jgi:inactivated superfamily I helicase
VSISETDQDAGVLLGDVLAGLLVLFALDADNRGKNPNALLAFLDLPA